MKTWIIIASSKIFRGLLVLLAMSITACAPPLTVPTAPEVPVDTSTTSDTNPTDTNPTDTITIQGPSRLIVTELEKLNKDIRPYYTAFSVATDQGTFTDYYLALKATNEGRPSADEIKKGLHYQRNLSTTPIYIYAWGAVDTVFSTPTSEFNVRAMLLRPGTNYSLYGLPKDGGDDKVKLWANFTTDQLALKVLGAPDNPLDMNIYNQTFSVRTGEDLVLSYLMQISTQFGAVVTLYSGTGDTQPSTALANATYSNSDKSYLMTPVSTIEPAFYCFIGQIADNLYNTVMLVHGINTSPSEGLNTGSSYVVQTPTGNYWFKTELTH